MSFSPRVVLCFLVHQSLTCSCPSDGGFLMPKSECNGRAKRNYLPLEDVEDGSASRKSLNSLIIRRVDSKLLRVLSI